LVVGIGASAGGVKPLQVLLENLPPESGLTFIVVMHLDPHRESGLAEVLQAHTKMPVVQVTKRVGLSPNHVYVIPPNKRLLANDQTLALADFEEPRGQRVPVDQLFRSLAEAHTDHAAGIILSGSGTDGALGMKEIKARGGFLLVQTPEEAEFPSMPQAAIATGQVDLILPVDEIARHVVELAAKGPVALNAAAKLQAEDPEVISAILSHLRSCVGHDFSHYKQPTILRRVARRMQVNRLGSLPEYLTLLRENGREAEALFRDLLIGVTSFFRDPSAWHALADTVIPRLFDGKGTGDSVRAWVSGCSSGEEAYTLAMLLHEHAATLSVKPAIQIFASDIDDHALETAREALFPDGIAADVPEARLHRFFTREGGHYRANKELRESLIFATHDLLRDPPFSRLDLITCRNLLIYLDREMQSRLFEIFHYALRPRGYLFLGSSESLGHPKLFQTLDKSHRLYQARVRSGEAHLPVLPLRPPQSIWPRRDFKTFKQRETPSEASMHRQMLEEYAPPSLIVDESFHLVHLSENAGRYLIPPGGPVSHDLTKLARPELRVPLRRALQKAFKEGTSTITRPVAVKFNGHATPVSMWVRPNQRKRHDSELLVLVVFLEESEASPRPPNLVPRTEGDDTVASLEEELHQTRLQLQATIEDYEGTNEELKAANEELQSMNEEYRSTTEELETSREELQSVNEELLTVNNELKAKLDEVSNAHSDLQNLMAATDIGTLFLDRDLRIKRHTPRISDLFNILPSDAGRPISHFTHAFRYDGLLSAAERVLKHLVPQEREIQGMNGRWYLMRLRPYRTIEDRIEGVVITFVDITDLRRAQEELRKSEEGARILMENVREYAIFLMDTHRRITTWNPGAEHIFGYTEEEAVGQFGDLIFTAEDRKAGAPEAEMKIAAREGESSDNRLHLRKNGTTFWAHGILAALYDKNGHLRGYAKVLRDNTDRKLAEDQLRELNETLEERVRERTLQLEAANKELEAFTYSVSHDLRAPLRGIRGFSGILHEEHQQELSRSAQDCLARIDASASRMDRMIQDLLDLSKIATSGLKRMPVNLSEIVEEIIQLLQMRFPDRRVRVEVAQGIIAAGDPGLLHEALENLLSNAWKYTSQKEDARIEFGVLRGEHGLEYFIRDNGAGFDATNAVDLFEPFRRFHSPEEFPGTGVGLSIVRRIFEKHGGSLRAESAPGEGATFFFRLQEG
jgi:two-component system, chemotaxis family, CheB/CheR fusion protein